MASAEVSRPPSELEDNLKHKTSSALPTTTEKTEDKSETASEVEPKMATEKQETEPEQDRQAKLKELPHSLKALGHVATIPPFLEERVKMTQRNKIETGDLINLTSLTDEERVMIQRVVQADLKLRRTVLGSLKRRIDEGQLLSGSAGEGSPRLCGYCGAGVSTICRKVLAGKCSVCGRLLCKKCVTLQTGMAVCTICKRNRILKLQTLDYQSILHYGIIEEDSVFETVQESELIKKSLQAASNLSKTKGEERPRSSSAIGMQTMPKVKPLEDRPRSATMGRSNERVVPKIEDVDSGFHLMAKASDESLVDLGSVYSEQCYFGVEITGRILMGVWYRTDEQRLYVRITQAEKLAAAADGTLDPYVKTYLLPGVLKSNKRKTGLQYDTKKPVWKEMLKYAGMGPEEIRTKTLWVSVWDWNRYGRQQFLGEVRIPLSGRDLTQSKDEWFKLNDSEVKPGIEGIDGPDDASVKPRVLLGVKFDPYSPEELKRLRDDKKGSLGYLRVKVKRAENLPAMDVNNRTDSFARLFLLPNQQLGGKKKTEIIIDSLNPIWEEEVVFNYVSLEELTTGRTLEVTLWDFDRRGTNQFIGGVRLGPNPLDVVHAFDWMDSMESESTHWEEMVDQPGQWVESWHNLRPTMDPIKTLREKITETMDRSSFSSISLPVTGSRPDYEEMESIEISTVSSVLQQPSDEKTKKSLESMEVSISRSGKGNYRISGEILTRIKYKDGALYIKIVRASGLAAVNRNGSSNPYVKVYLLPDRSKDSKRKTAVQKRTVDPIFKEVFKYKVEPSEIQLRTLWLTVWNDGGSLTKNLFMGETCISLAGDLKHSTERWFELHDFSEAGMVVMATPFGRTPPHKTEVLNNDIVLGPTPQEAGDDSHSAQLEGTGDGHLSEEGDQLKELSIPIVNVEDTEAERNKVSSPIHRRETPV